MELAYTAEQLRLAKVYSTDVCEFLKEDMFCLGCISDTLSEKMCGGCEIRKCGIEKDCGNCAKCAEFPCSVLEKYIGDNSDNMSSLKQQLADKYKEAE